jgi:hypothetical protein
MGQGRAYDGWVKGPAMMMGKGPALMMGKGPAMTIGAAMRRSNG